MYIYIPIYEELFMSYMCDFISSWSNHVKELSQCSCAFVVKISVGNIVRVRAFVDYSL